MTAERTALPHHYDGGYLFSARQLEWFEREAKEFFDEQGVAIFEISTRRTGDREVCANFCREQMQ